MRHRNRGVVREEDLSEHDRREVELFRSYLRRLRDHGATETREQSYAAIYGEQVYPPTPTKEPDRGK